MELIIFLPVIISLIASFIIAYFSKKKLVKNGNKYAVLISIVIFIASFLLIGFAILALIVYNIRFER